MQQHRIVTIRGRRPWLRAAIVAGVVAVLAIGGYLLVVLARSSTAREFKRTRTALEQLQDERAQLARDLRASRAENAELRQQVVYAERSSEIDGQACEEVKSSLAGLQAEVADLQEQVAFYRGVVSPDQGRAGVRVLELKVSPLEPAGRWHYDLVLIQSMRNEKRVAGKRHIAVIGSRNGAPERIELSSSPSDTDATPPGFAFKYFQEIGGSFSLPADFRPLRVVVTLSVDGDAAAQVEQEFDWSKIQAAGAPT